MFDIFLWVEKQKFLNKYPVSFWSHSFFGFALNFYIFIEIGVF